MVAKSLTSKLIMKAIVYKYTGTNLHTFCHLIQDYDFESFTNWMKQKILLIYLSNKEKIVLAPGEYLIVLSNGTLTTSSTQYFENIGRGFDNFNPKLVDITEYLIGST